MIVTAFYHSGYATPLGDHIMPINKFALVADGLAHDPRVRLEEPAPLDEADLLRVHTPDYVTAVRTGAPRALAESQKFPWSPQLYPSVRLTGGGCLAAARLALDRGMAAALVSGFHHAHGDHGEGFCTFNGLVVAIDALVAARHVERVAILDMDLHYGNDYDRNQAFRDVTVMRHRDGDNHRSIALPNGSGRAEMLEAMEASFSLIRAWARPDLLLYQAGADPYFEDPYSPLELDHDDLFERDRRVFEFARHERIPIAWVLAGGYTKDTAKVVRVHLNTFRAALGASP